MCVYRDLIKPLLFQLDPEQAHHLVHKLISHGTLLLAGMSGGYTYTDNDLKVTIFGKTLSNPIGLAAGFDKNGDLVHALKYLGFGYEEVGSISARTHEGNPKPRIWRLPADNALINWMGLNSEGASHIANKLAAGKYSLPIAVNIVKTNKPDIKGEAVCEDMLASFRAVSHLPIFYITINVSCPNTSDGVIEETGMLTSLLAQINQENSAKLPILLKLSPDSDDLLIREIVELGKKFAIAGYVCGNTTRERTGLITSKQIVESIKAGGLSGPPLKSLALSLCRKIYQLKDEKQIILGCGGISNGQDAYDFIRAGASALQLYTALVYEGPGVVRKICTELSALLKKNGLTLSKAIGIDCSSTVVSKS